MTTKKIRFLIAFHDMGLGGIQKKVLDLISFINQNHPNIEIRLCLRRPDGIFIKLLPRGVKVSAPRRPLYRFGGPRFVFWMAKEIVLFNPTHILTFMDFSAIPTFIALKLIFWKKPRVVIGEDILTSKYLADLYDPITAAIRLQRIQKYYPLANKIIVQTPIQKQDLENLLFDNKKSNKIVALPNWLPLDYPPPVNNIKRDIDILFVGRIAAQKNLPKFIEIIKIATKTNPKIIVKIIGSGEDELKIKKLISQNKLQKNIEMVGATTSPVQYYLRSKFFLLSSDYEGFPLTLMEAVSCGCYPVSNNLPEIRLFFDKYRTKILFNNVFKAATLISQPINHNIISYYKNKLIFLQNKNIKLTISTIFQ